MSIFVKDNILYWFNKPAFQYLDIVSIRIKEIFYWIDGNIKAKYKGRIVHGIIDGASNNGWQKVQLIKLL